MPAAFRSAFTATKRMVNGVHGRTTDSRSDAEPPGLACLADGDVLVIDIADLADRRHTGKVYQAHAA
jgi:hypothetical protein